MRHEKRIVEAFKFNGITKILLIDDAYDSPQINETIIGTLLDFFESTTGRAVCVDLGIDNDVLGAANVAAHEGDAHNESLQTVYRTLYDKYARTQEKRYEPDEYFHEVKGAALAALGPLSKFLKKCSDAVEMAGLGNGMECYRRFRPHVLFLDYYLDDQVLPTGNVNKHTMANARKASLSLLKQVIYRADVQELPAVVLMSSRLVDDVDEYRHAAGGELIMSLRFGFLRKNLMSHQGGDIAIGQEASEVLLDTSQGYLFGTVLQQALSRWKVGAESALKDLLKEVGDLHIKDFAYLLRFRLREEGQPLSEYVEWLFGECLTDLIDERTDWEHESFLRLDGNERLEEKIEGAFEGPSDKIAGFLQRVKVRKRRSSEDRGYQLGDLYAQPRGSDIRVVITPDCDLVVRNGRTKVESVLTMGGTLHTFDEDGAAADDFIRRGKKTYCVRWNPKDLQTYPIKGEDALSRTDKLKYLGTLRPMYAQEMQRKALTNLSRVGLPVTPAFGINATATAWIRKTDASDPFKQINMHSPIQATIIPARTEQQRDGHSVLLHRRSVNELIERLNEIDPNEMKKDDARLLKKIRKDGGTDKIYKGFLKEGGFTKAGGIFGTGFVLGDKPETKEDAPWLQIVLKVSGETMKELQIIDPLIA